MAIDFSDRILITNPTSYHLGRGILFVGLVDLAIGGITYYFDQDFLLPPLAWCIMSAPTLAIGGILMACGLTKA